tara:strand:- start:422 stop:808 length:387 start_codon:yes stop_codon:yes gene_type:complete
MSEIRATTISDAAGTGPITLTGQSAAKAHFGFNQDASTVFGMPTNTLSSQSFNVASYTDNGLGDATVALTSAMANTGFTFLSGMENANNTRTLEPTSTASSLDIITNDADTSSKLDKAGWAALMGDLA